MRNWSSICPKMSSDSVPAAVQTGKSDFAAGCITITDEREESINRFRKRNDIWIPQRQISWGMQCPSEGRECAGQ